MTKNKFFIMLLISICLILVPIFNKNVSCVLGVTVGTQQEWVETIEEWTNLMLNDGGWTYSNSNIKTSWESAMNGNKKTNCALMVCHALQRFGVLDTNMKFYGHANGYIKYGTTATKERLKSIATIIDYSDDKVVVTSLTDKLQQGDIVMFYTKGKTAGHTAIYRGVNESGKQLWWDAGKAQTTTPKKERRDI